MLEFKVLGPLRAGRLDDQLAVHQLTAAQQLKLDHQPRLAMAPREILVALGLDGHEGATQDIPERPFREIT